MSRSAFSFGAMVYCHHMPFDERWYPKPNPEVLAQVAREEGSKRANQGAPSLRLVHSVRERANQAVQRLGQVYEDPRASDEDERMIEQETSGVHRIKFDQKTGAVIGSERVDPSEEEALLAQANATSERAAALMGRYSQAMAEVGNAEKQITRLEGELRQLTDRDAAYSDAAFAQRAKQIAQSLQEWKAWRDGQMRMANEIVGDAGRNQAEYDSIKEIRDTKAAKERSVAEVAAVRVEYQRAVEKGREYDEAILAAEAEGERLNQRIASAMEHVHKMQENLKRLELLRSRETSFWPFGKAARRREELNQQIAEQANEVEMANQGLKYALSEVALQNRRLEPVLTQKEANDRQIRELSQRLSSITAPANRQAA